MIGIVSLFASCEETSSPDDVLLPSNLTMSVTVSEESPANVTVNYSANNVNFYRVNFGEGDGFEEMNQTSASHTYQSEGEFTITVQAHVTANDFVSTEESVTITLPDPGEFSTEGYTTPASYEGYDLVWQDEFDGSALSNDWTHEIGTGSNGWGNNELQYYRSENTEVRDGYLRITAKEENFGGQNYTSSRIITENKQEFKYGRIDIRAILPVGQGVWPALWMLGANFREVGWPACGEIDIMEKIGGGIAERQVFGTLHWDNNGQHACTCNDGTPYQLESGTFGDEFHVFTLLWDENQIQWLVDDNLYHTIDTSPEGLNEFREEFFFIFNVAVGGNLPGSPDASTVFPQQMIVDYIRVFQQQ